MLVPSECSAFDSTWRSIPPSETMLENARSFFKGMAAFLFQGLPAVQGVASIRMTSAIEPLAALLGPRARTPAARLPRARNTCKSLHTNTDHGPWLCCSWACTPASREARHPRVLWTESLCWGSSLPLRWVLAVLFYCTNLLLSAEFAV